MGEISAKYPHGAPAWIDLLTPNRGRALDFYRALLGWEFAGADDGVSAYTMCLLQGRQVSSIGDLDEHVGASRGWTTYLSVDDVDSVAAEAMRHGGAVLMGPLDLLTLGRLALIADPSKAVVGLWQARDHYGAQIIDVPGAFAYSELLVQDVETACSFYQNILNWRLSPARDGHYTTVVVGDREVAGIRGAGSAASTDEPLGWTVCFRVVDSGAAAAQAVALGADVLAGPRQAPPGDITLIRDPVGASFGVVGERSDDHGAERRRAG
jgi:predicted enzyme related to lactoylglutathione lyase